MIHKHAIRLKEVLESLISELTNPSFTENVGAGQEAGQSELIDDESTGESHPQQVEDAHVRLLTETMQLPVMGEAHHLDDLEGQREKNPLNESVHHTKGCAHQNPQHSVDGDQSSQTTQVNRKTTETP